MKAEMGWVGIVMVLALSFVVSLKYGRPLIEPIQPASHYEFTMEKTDIC